MHGLVDNTHQVPASEKPEITSAPMSGPALEEPTASDGITWQSFEHETNASCQWSKPYSKQVRRLRYHWKKVLADWTRAEVEHVIEEVEQEDEEVEYEEVKKNLDNSKNSPWFARAVLQLRNAPCLESCEVEIDQSLRGLLVSGSKLTSLNLAVLMQDSKMVKEILKKCPSPNNGIHRPLVDPQRAMDFLKVSTSNLAKNGFLFTPLHLAVTVDSRFIIGPLLEKGADVNAPNWLLQTPLELAAKLVISERCLNYLLNDLARADVMKYKKKMPLHILATKPYHRFDVRHLIEALDKRRGIDIRALDESGLSAFYVAILCCNTRFVNVLLEHFEDRIRLNEECVNALGPPIQIAFEGGDDFKDIERALMECEPIKGYIDKLYRDRQVYVDAANAILVGAALIASVTFASWLQPPLNYTSYSGEGYSTSIPTPTTSDLNYVDVEHNIPLRAFWIFNALSFYFAIGSVVCGARSVLPRRHLFIKKIVERLRTNLLVTSVLLACSMLFVIIAFAIAGTIVLTPSLKYQWYMIIPTLVGGVVCIISLVFMVKNMREIFSDKRGKSEPFNSKRIDCLHNRGYTVQESPYI